MAFCWAVHPCWPVIHGTCNMGCVKEVRVLGPAARAKCMICKVCSHCKVMLPLESVVSLARCSISQHQLYNCRKIDAETERSLGEGCISRTYRCRGGRLSLRLLRWQGGRSLVSAQAGICSPHHSTRTYMCSTRSKERAQAEYQQRCSCVRSLFFAHSFSLFRALSLSFFFLSLSFALSFSLFRALSLSLCVCVCVCVYQNRRRPYRK